MCIVPEELSVRIRVRKRCNAYIDESFHRAQLKINGSDSRRYLNCIFSRTNSTRTVLPVFGCNFSLATGRQRDERWSGRVLVYCLTRPSRAGIEYRVCINDDTRPWKKKSGTKLNACGRWISDFKCPVKVSACVTEFLSCLSYISLFLNVPKLNCTLVDKCGIKIYNAIWELVFWLSV